MTLEEQFDLIAREYDAGRRKFIACFDDFYDRTTALIAACFPAPERILDLGAGTGLLSRYYLRHFPRAEYVLVDAAPGMLQVARERFAGLANFRFLVEDYTRTLPEGPFDWMVSALSIHHLEPERKAALFRAIHAALPPGGVFINYDQFCAATPEWSQRMDAVWTAELERSGLSPVELERWRERRKLDRECSPDAEITLLKASGFAPVECWYRCGKFAVIVACRPEVTTVREGE